LTPANPEKFSKEAEENIYNDLGKKVKVIVVDANDIGVNILSDRKYKNEVSILSRDLLVADNPMGQGSESTPIIIARKK
jgi:F420-0:gamma-glutamyl ligase